jgi:solute carrier family 25 phosphate transporter 23/24/25/41
MVTLNSEGDSLVSDDTLEGLGTVGFLLQGLFGSLLKLADPEHTYSSRSFSSPTASTESSSSELAEPAVDQVEDASEVDALSAVAVTTTEEVLDDSVVDVEDDELLDTPKIHQEATKKPRLTEFLPEPGYFLAGAISGGVSRTATAPLDRLKVYLLVNTKTGSNVALEAAKHGHPLTALRRAGQPIADAVVTLWKAGGLRTFFAGKHLPSRCISFLFLQD